MNKKNAGGGRPSGNKNERRRTTHSVDNIILSLTAVKAQRARMPKDEQAAFLNMVLDRCRELRRPGVRHDAFHEWWKPVVMFEDLHVIYLIEDIEIDTTTATDTDDLPTATLRHFLSPGMNADCIRADDTGTHTTRYRGPRVDVRRVVRADDAGTRTTKYVPDEGYRGSLFVYEHDLVQAFGWELERFIDTVTALKEERDRTRRAFLHWLVKPPQLKLLFHRLAEGGFLHDDTLPGDFEGVMTGNVCRPVRWIGTQATLRFIVDYLTTEKLIEPCDANTAIVAAFRNKRGDRFTHIRQSVSYTKKHTQHRTHEDAIRRIVDEVKSLC